MEHLNQNLENLRQTVPDLVAALWNSSGGLSIGIKTIDPAPHFDRRVHTLGPVGDLSLALIAIGAGALHQLMAPGAELGAIAPLESARGQIARLHDKFHQASDGDNMGLACFCVRGRIGIHTQDSSMGLGWAAL